MVLSQHCRMDANVASFERTTLRWACKLSHRATGESGKRSRTILIAFMQEIRS
jgi:hypothetical protein